MGDWYWIGVLVGIGAALGVLAAGVVGGRRLAGFGIVVAAAVAAGIGDLRFNWDEGLGGLVGAVVAGVAALPIVAGTLRRGGTRFGTAVLVGGLALLLAALAFVPVLGYVEAVVVPALAVRMRRRSPERYAGLRTLARD